MMKIRKPKRKLAKRLQRSMYAFGGVEKDLTDNYDYDARWNETFWGTTAAATASGAAMGATVGGPWGAAIGGTIGTIGGMIGGAISGDNNAEKQQGMFAQARQRRKDRRTEIETNLLEDFPSQGIEGASYNAAYGGNINPNNMRKKLYYQQGGQMTMAGQSPQGGFQQLASNVQEVQGASHEQGGVPLSRGAEVEGGEVVSNQMDGSKNIFSDRLAFSEGVSFADKAAQLGKKKSKHEEKMDSDSLFTKGTARRNIDKIEAELQKLFAMQEQMKQAMGIPSPEEQAAMEQQQGMQQQGMEQQGMEQQGMEQQQGMPQQGMPQQMVQQQMAQQMGQQGQQQGQFRMGGKLKYATGGAVNAPIINPPTNENLKIKVVNIEKDYGLELGSEEGNELAFKLAKEALANGEMLKFKCSSGQQCAGQINTLEANIGKRLAEDIVTKQTELKRLTPIEQRQHPEYLNLMASIRGLGVYGVKDAWKTDDPLLTEAIAVADFYKQQWDKTKQKAGTPLEFESTGKVPELIFDPNNPNLPGATVGLDRYNTDKSDYYASKKFGATNKGMEHVGHLDPSGMINHPTTGEPGWLIGSPFANKSGQAYKYIDFISKNDPMGHRGGKHKYSVVDVTKKKSNIEGKQKLTDLEKALKIRQKQNEWDKIGKNLPKQEIAQIQSDNTNVVSAPMQKSIIPIQKQQLEISEELEQPIQNQISEINQNTKTKAMYNRYSEFAYGGKDKGKKKKRKSKFSAHMGLENSALQGTAQYQINPQLSAFAHGNYNLAPLLQGQFQDPHASLGVQYAVPNQPVTLRGQANVGSHGISGVEAGLKYNFGRRNTPQVNPYLMATGGKLKYYYGGPNDYDPGLGGLAGYQGTGTVTPGFSEPNPSGMRNKSGGGMSMNANQAIGAASNLVGDFGNMLLTAGMEETPTPETYYAKPLPTTVSTAATENAMRNAARDTNKMHLQNTASAQGAKANIAQTTAMGQAQLNKVHQDRINQENQLKTANRMNQQQVTMMNTQAQAAYKQQNLLREGTKRSEMSANLASVTGKVPQMMAEKNQMNKDLFEVQLLAKQYKDNGIWNRNIQKLFSDFYNGTITREALTTGLTNTGNPPRN